MLVASFLVACILSALVALLRVFNREHRTAKRAAVAPRALDHRAFPNAPGTATLPPSGAAGRAPVASQALNYRALPDVPGRYTLHLAGEQFDGRQATIRELKVGTPLLFRREPDNPYDSCAVAVTTVAGRDIGYIPRRNSEWVSNVLDSGYDLSVSTAHLFDDDGDGVVDVQVHIDGVPTRDAVRSRTKFTPLDALERDVQDVLDAIHTAQRRVTPKAQLRWYRRAGFIAETAYKKFSPKLQQGREASQCYAALLDAIQTAAARIQQLEARTATKAGSAASI